MNRHPSQHDDSWESDPVWKLLDATPAPGASERFLERTVREARLAGCTEKPWWRKLMSPAPLGGLAAAAAVVFAVVALNNDSSVPTEGGNVADREGIPAENFAAIQEAAEAEALMAVVDQLDDFSDRELVHLIGL